MEFQPFFADEPSLHSYDFTDTDEFEVEDKEIDDSSNSAGIDEYDMQNNETFGTGFVQSDNDMEEFANQVKTECTIDKRRSIYEIETTNN